MNSLPPLLLMRICTDLSIQVGRVSEKMPINCIFSSCSWKFFHLRLLRFAGLSVSLSTRNPLFLSPPKYKSGCHHLGLGQQDQWWDLISLLVFSCLNEESDYKPGILFILFSSLYAIHSFIHLFRITFIVGPLCRAMCVLGWGVGHGGYCDLGIQAFVSAFWYLTVWWRVGEIDI